MGDRVPSPIFVERGSKKKKKKEKRRRKRVATLSIARKETKRRFCSPILRVEQNLITR